MGLPVQEGSEALDKASVRSLYMADTCIQGDNFPAHILWNKSSARILVKYPSSIGIKQVYNVPEGGRRDIGEGLVEFSEYGVNGYVGLMFETKKLENTLVREQVGFEIRFPGANPERYVKEVYLFRPSLEITSVPTELHVKYDPDKRSWKTTGRIRVQNAGAGTALIHVQLASQDAFELSRASDIDEFRKQFLADLEIKLNTLSTAHVQHSNALRGFLSLLKSPPIFDAKGRADMEFSFDELARALEDDEEFAKSFASALVTAYLKNVQVITELTSFMEYLNSIGEGRVIMVNSLDVIKPKKNRGQLRLLIRITDLAYSDYPHIELSPMTVTWEGEAPMPIHMLFDWKARPSGVRKIG